eukprot:2999042-Rhodomonas_salina.1
MPSQNSPLNSLANNSYAKSNSPLIRSSPSMPQTSQALANSDAQSNSQQPRIPGAPCPPEARRASCQRPDLSLAAVPGCAGRGSSSRGCGWATDTGTDADTDTAAAAAAADSSFGEGCAGGGEWAPREGSASSP